MVCPFGTALPAATLASLLYEKDIPQLFAMVANGTPVAVVDRPVKVAAEAGRVDLEVRGLGDGRDLDRKAFAALRGKGPADRADLEKVRKANRERTGLVVDVKKR